MPSLSTLLISGLVQAAAGFVAALGILLIVFTWIVPVSSFMQKTVNCPGCGSSDVRISRLSGLLDQIRMMFSLYPCRCRSCKNRYFRMRKTADPMLEARASR